MQTSLWKVKVSEAEVLKVVMDVLRIKGVFVWRNNSGAYADATSGRYIRFGKKGAADILGVYPGGKNGEKRGAFFAIECKRPTGGLLSDDQIEFLRAIRRAGGVAVVATCAEDIFRVLDDPTSPSEEKYEKLLG